ncbi:MAG: PilN domain-containing protein [Nitrospirae bacterium]|nr:PilN domain-containing protein [Nitrospirota bacterium]MBF0542317.1 PilN domain-containing protein [Nitrospirota bacterium]
MIRINLLPPEKRKKAQKKKKVKEQKEKKVRTGPSLTVNEKVPIISGVVLILLALGAAGYLYLSLNKHIASLNKEKKDNIAAIAALDKKLKQIKNLDSLISDLNQREKLINKLRLDQSQPIRVLDELNTIIPETVWFEALSVIGNKLDIEGSGLSYSDVVGFVNSLKQSKIFRNVELRNAKNKTSGKETVYVFKVTMDIIGD